MSNKSANNCIEFSTLCTFILISDIKPCYFLTFYPQTPHWQPHQTEMYRCTIKYGKEREVEMRTSFLFPSLHQEVVDAVSNKVPSTWFHEDDVNESYNNERLINVTGYFKCPSIACY